VFFSARIKACEISYFSVNSSKKDAQKRQVVFLPTGQIQTQYMKQPSRNNAKIPLKVINRKSRKLEDFDNFSSTKQN
jgi:hypothetical protein